MAYPPSIDLPPAPCASLSYSDRCLGDEGVTALCVALEHRRDVTNLDLRGCHVHAGGATALAELLVATGGARLGSLSLEWNALGTSDAGPRASGTRLWDAPTSVWATARRFVRRGRDGGGGAHL